MDEITEQKIKLQRDAIEAEQLNSLKSHNGWNVLIGIFQELYVAEAENLIEADSPEARATMKALQKIVDRIDGKISLGQVAKEELKKPVFNKLQGTP